MRAGDCKNRERDTTNEMKQTGGTKAARSEGEKMEEAEEGSLTSGYWSLTRHSKEESVDKTAVAGEEGE